jgi:hypothetical protein
LPTVFFAYDFDLLPGLFLAGLGRHTLSDGPRGQAFLSSAGKLGRLAGLILLGTFVRVVENPHGWTW